MFHKMYVVVPLQFSKIFIHPSTPLITVAGYRPDRCYSILGRQKYL